MSNVSDQNQGYVQMPRYRCDKTVYALQIKANEAHGDHVLLRFEDERYAPKKVSWEWFQKRVPRDASPAGGYLVVYQDGYESWSPKEAFEAGYTRLP